MKVWILNDFDHGAVDVYSADTNVLEIPMVKTELGYLGEAYAEEREAFENDVIRAIARDGGSATIEERFTIELVEVK